MKFRSSLINTALQCASLPWTAAAWADGAHAFAAPDAAAPAAAGAAAGIGQVTLSLGIVLLAIFGLAWLMRRVRGFSRKGRAGIEVLSEIGLGTRERAVVVKFGATRLLLGVAPGRVNLLHVLPADETLPTSGSEGDPGSAVAATRPTFFSLLQKSLGR